MEAIEATLKHKEEERERAMRMNALDSDNHKQMMD